MSDTVNPAGFSGWRVITLASFAHLWSYGLTFGTYSASVLAIQEQFDTTRMISSLPISIVTAALVLLAPVLGMLYERHVSIRRSMMLGAVLGTVGHLGIALTHDWRVMLACYTFMIGPSIALTGSVPGSVLATNWFVARRGIALGIVNLPLGLMIMPMLAAMLLQRGGLEQLFIVTGLAYLLIIPAAFYLIDRPEQVNQFPLENNDETTASMAENIPAKVLPVKAIFSRFDFWALVVTVGIIVGGSAMKYAHMVPLLGEQGHSIEQATLLLSISGGSGIIGALLFGWLADRFGGAKVIISTAIVQALMWFIFLLPVDMTLLSIDAFIIGICGGGIGAANGVCICQRFGQINFSRVFGLVAFSLFPFLTGINPMTGYLRDSTGDYHMAITVLIVASALAAMLLALATSRKPKLENAVAA